MAAHVGRFYSDDLTAELSCDLKINWPDAEIDLFLSDMCCQLRI